MDYLLAIGEGTSQLGSIAGSFVDAATDQYFNTGQTGNNEVIMIPPSVPRYSTNQVLVKPETKASRDSMKEVVAMSKFGRKNKTTILSKRQYDSEDDDDDLKYNSKRRSSKPLDPNDFNDQQRYERR